MHYWLKGATLQASDRQKLLQLEARMSARVIGQVPSLLVVQKYQKKMKI